MISVDHLKVFLPRSRVSQCLMLLVLSAAYWLAPLIDAEHRAPWLAQYMAASVMAMVGLSLGNTLAAIRAWPVSLLVPSLLHRHMVTASAVALVLWASVVLVMLINHGTNGYALSVSLATAAVAMMLSAGIHRKMTPWIIAAVVLVMTPDATRLQLEVLLRQPWMEVLCLAICFAAVAELFRHYREAPSVSEAAHLHRKHVMKVDREMAEMGRLSTYWPLGDVSPKRGLSTAIEFSGRQAWLNDLMLLVVVNGLVVLAFLPGWGTTPVYAASALLMSLLAITMPLFARRRFLAAKTFLWLSGVTDDRFQLGLRSFLIMMKSPLRLVGMGLILLTVFNGLSPDEESTLISFSLLVTCTGTAGIMLLAALLLVKDNEPSNLTFAFSALMTVIFVLGGWFAAWLSVSLSIGPLVITAGLYSLVSVVVCAIVYGVWLRAGDL